MKPRFLVTPDVARWAGAFARARYADSRANGLANRNGLVDADPPTQLEEDYRGALGEWAWRRFFDFEPFVDYIPLSSGRSTKDPDIPPDVEVKCVKDPQHRLFCREDDNPRYRFALAYFDGACVTLEGWRTGYGIRHFGIKQDPGRKGPIWYLNHKYLLEPDDLRRLIQGG